MDQLRASFLQAKGHQMDMRDGVNYGIVIDQFDLNLLTQKNLR